MKIYLKSIFVFAMFGCVSNIIDSEDHSDPTNNLLPSYIDESWTSFFSGENLNQFTFIGDAEWEIIDNYVEAVDGLPKFLVTNSAFRDIELYAEFWTSPNANSGIFVRCQDIHNIAAGTCYEVNIFDQRPDQRYRTGGIVNFAEPMGFQNAANQWNQFLIRIVGNHTEVYLNDELMIDMEDDTFFAGPIAYQWSAGTVRFRNLWFRVL